MAPLNIKAAYSLGCEYAAHYIFYRSKKCNDDMGSDVVISNYMSTTCIFSNVVSAGPSTDSPCALHRAIF